MPLPLSIKELDSAAKTIADAIDRHAAVLAAINGTLQGLGKIMHDEVAAFLVQFDTATNAVAARIDRLLAEASMSPELKVKFQAEVDRLTVLGKDPENPIPPETTS